ncbi:FUSC family protein [Planosporangium flavigriseum]|uniref:FUSC family protein n=1 Tax=Planosporangium flavigriseum TaxID=373681 RepID=UPI001439A6B2|nr:aromatic acid exporter family protein [Planosporangium flavigriseum]NJC65007.1 FUSC family protein [Planosporangium flavigriseum]
MRRNGRLPGSQTAKVAVATVAAYVVAEGLLHGAQPPLLAALSALLIVQVTLYDTIRHGWQRIGSVVVGVVLAALLSSVVGLTWWSLGITVLAALVLGRLLRLGDHAVEVPISAMFVLAVSSHTQVGLGRVYETLIGAVVGVLVSLLAPPVYVQPAGDAIGELAEELGDLLHSVAADIDEDWTREYAADALRRARGLEVAVRTARSALNRAENSLRLNPRRRAAHVPKRLRSGLTALEYSTIHVRVTCRCLVDRVDRVSGTDTPGPEVRRPLAALLDAAGEAVTAFGRLVASDVAGPAGDADGLRQAVRRARTLRDVASSALRVDAGKEPEIWRAHGAVLEHLDRLLDEIDPDAEEAAYAIGRVAPARGPAAASLARLSPGGLRRRIPAGLRHRSAAVRPARPRTR